MLVKIYAEICGDKSRVFVFLLNVPIAILAHKFMSQMTNIPKATLAS